MCRRGEPSPALRYPESRWEGWGQDQVVAEEAAEEVHDAPADDRPLTHRTITNNTLNTSSSMSTPTCTRAM